MQITCPTCQQSFVVPTVQSKASASITPRPIPTVRGSDANSPRVPVVYKVRVENWNQKNDGSEFRKWWGKNNRLPFTGKLTIGDGKLDFSGKQESVFGKPFTKQFPLCEIVNVEQNDATLTFDCANAGNMYITGLVVQAANNKDAAAIAGLLPSDTTTEFVEKQEQKAAFVSALTTVTPVAYVTPAIVGLNVLMYVIMGIAGVGWFSPEPAKMVTWGADFWPLTTDGEWWRLLTNTFLHFGLVHLCFNMVALLNAGIFSERLFGNKSFAAIYLFGMVASSIGSDWWYHNDKVVCAGASGAIFAVYGALLAYLAFQSNSFPKDAVKPLVSNAVVFVCYNVFYGAAHEGISNAAHLTGLASGFLSGAAFCRPLDAARRNAQAVPRFFIGIIVCVMVVAVGLFLMPKSHGLTTEDLQAQIQESIQQTFLKDPATKGIQVQGFNLIHDSGNKYKGMLTAQTDGKTETVEVDVKYDGKGFMWKVLPQTIPATAPAVADAAQAQDSPEAQAAELRTCINNLRLIDSSKQQWALEHRQTSHSRPTASDLTPYLGSGGMPKCPAGGVYSINSVAEAPTCSIPGHVLSDTPEPATASAQSQAVQLDWNKQETDAMKNGNIPFGIRTILANPALRSKAKTQDPQMVAKTPWNYYGQVVKLSGQVGVVQDFPQGSDFGQMLGGHDGSDIVIASQDGTIVELFCMKPSGRMKVGDNVNLYGYPTGITEVPNRLGGNDVHLILIGNDYDDLGAR